MAQHDIAAKMKHAFAGHGLDLDRGVLLQVLGELASFGILDCGEGCRESCKTCKDGCKDTSK